MVKALEGHNTKPGRAGVRGFTSQRALSKKVGGAVCPPGLLTVTAIEDKGRFLKRKNVRLTSPAVQKWKM